MPFHRSDSEFVRHLVLIQQCLFHELPCVAGAPRAGWETDAAVAPAKKLTPEERLVFGKGPRWRIVTAFMIDVKIKVKYSLSVTHCHEMGEVGACACVWHRSVKKLQEKEGLCRCLRSMSERWNVQPICSSRVFQHCARWHDGLAVSALRPTGFPQPFP